MFNLRFAKDYLLHRFKAKNRHGIHSPFVYRLADKLIYDFDAKKVYAEVENLREQLFLDNRIITITDLAGLRLNSGCQKKIKDVAHHALKSPKLAQLLYRLVADLKPSNIIELGTSLGITTVYLQKAALGAKVYTLEGCPQTAEIAKETFEKAGISDVELITGDFDNTLSGLINNLDRLDFVFVDGNHRKDATLKYFEWCLPKVHKETLLIFDDIYWSEGMKQAWSEIKAHPKVTVAIDLFWIGLVFFKSGRVKEDFLIRL